MLYKSVDFCPSHPAPPPTTHTFRSPLPTQADSKASEDQNGINAPVGQSVLAQAGRGCRRLSTLHLTLIGQRHSRLKLLKVERTHSVVSEASCAETNAWNVLFTDPLHCRKGKLLSKNYRTHTEEATAGFTWGPCVCACVLGEGYAVFRFVKHH